MKIDTSLFDSELRFEDEIDIEIIKDSVAKTREFNYRKEAKYLHGLTDAERMKIEAGFLKMEEEDLSFWIMF